ncbi:MAG: hypothetical protein ACP5HQ_00370 [Thermoprotei archaeon]
MSLRWTPKWTTRKVEHDGAEVEACFDETTKLYACPICVPQCRSGGLSNEGSYFFSEDDLVEHLKAHKTAPWRARKTDIEEDETEEEEEEIEEE